MTATRTSRAADPLAALSEVDADTRSRLHARLVEAAAGTGALDLAYRTVDSPFGRLLLVATPQGLVRVAFAIEDHDRVLEHLAATISRRVLQAPARLDAAARQIDEYMVGRRTAFDLPVDLQLSSGFRRTVLGQLRTIGYGERASYAAVALAVGNPRAVRAVGSACATNPVPIVVPCHRVVRSDGTIGRYAGGSQVKRALLELEGAP